MTSVLLAMNAEPLSAHLTHILKTADFEVFNDVVLHLKYLDETVDFAEPDILILHDTLIQADNLDEAELEEREEQLLKLIQKWRAKYDTQLRVVFLCIREHTDPFLSQLVALNVLDIFYTNQISNERLINQLLEPPRFVNVQRIGTGTGSLVMTPFEEEETPDTVHDTEDELLQEENETEPLEKKDKGEFAKKVAKQASKIGLSIADGAVKGAKGAVQLKDKLPKLEQKDDKQPIDDFLMDDLLNLMPIEQDKQQIAPPTIIGTVLIAVSNVRAHLGSTHTALSVGSYLKHLGHSVAVIETNYSQDFDRIHSLYEGEQQLLKKDHFFEMNGISHYKYRNDLDLNHLYSAYEYVIMDYGDLQEAAAYTEEFKRAHIRLVVCSGDEWKFHWIEKFLKQNKIDKEECTFIIPASSDDKAKDLQDRLQYTDVYALPVQDNPYEPVRGTEQLFHSILQAFVKAPNRTFSKKTIIATSVISIAITAIILTIFNTL